ncbi:unnamed protein product [Adineta ricciae]|uniref:Uncharacterized protein n=2 Tax=Adineta ricciae TaxID=249248 RepID=A0A815XQY3_ADIRI|nr:unnamed protein product [Adineta ricciae]
MRQMNSLLKKVPYTEKKVTIQPRSQELQNVEKKNMSAIKALKLSMKDLFQNRHTVVRNASFSRQHTLIADISKLDIPLHATKQQQYSYNIDDLVFGITTTVERLVHIIRSLRFWTRDIGIRCLITFHHTEIKNLETARKLFEMEQIPCLTDITFTRRYVERFFDLVNRTWSLLANKTNDSSNKEVKWLLIGDDDTLWLIPNLLRTLNNYNYKKPTYLGDHSDHLESMQRFGRYYAYGGGGIAFSRPLAQNLAHNISFCDKYKELFGGDMMLGKCATEVMKVQLSRDVKFHQMDIRGDATGYFESGIQGLVSIHHMFSWWSPVPGWVSEDKEDIVDRFYQAYRSTSFSYLKRYIWIDWEYNETLVLTLGYSVTIYKQTLTSEQITAVEATFCCVPLVRRSRTPITHRQTWYFAKSYTKNRSSDNVLHHIYEYSAADSNSSYILVIFYS